MNPIGTIDGKCAGCGSSGMFGIHAIYDCSIDGIIRIIHTVLTGLQFEGEGFHRGTGFLRRCLHGKRYRTIGIDVCNGFDNRSA